MAALVQFIGAAKGPAVLLLHGWPCDIYSIVDVVPALVAARRPRPADIGASLWPERCKGLVSVSGYLIGSRANLPEAPQDFARAVIDVDTL